MTISAIGWLATVASLIGVILNIRHDRRCFIVWGITNAIWVVVDASSGVWSQATLQAVYCVLSVYGFMKWKIKDCESRNYEVKDGDDAR